MLRIVGGIGATTAASVALIWMGRRLQTTQADRVAREGSSVGEFDERHLAHQLSSVRTIFDDTVADNQKLFGDEELKLIEELIKLGQDQLFRDWPPPGQADDEKRQLVAQLLTLDHNYPGGLKAYLEAAKQLLRESREGKNSFEGYVPHVPDGVLLDWNSPDFLQFESQGVKEAGTAAFVLVAGGLGERLGYGGIKVALPVESATGRCFLEHYIASILALQAAAGGKVRLPLAIMTSDDTHARTEALLKEHNYFGMATGQVTLIKQEKVACLADGDAHLATAPSSRWQLLTKPHGHGDVHALLHTSGLLKDWVGQGLKWVCFFQDTNGLVFNALPAALGVSAARGYDVNSLAVPRKAKEAIGALALLQPADAGSGLRSMTVNVEYNLLDPLLRATVNPDGDVNDETTGLSPFPGNINQLVFRLQPYASVLAETGGQVPQFVNPKYQAGPGSAFKSPTRLECMMQDLPRAYPPSAKVGFTVINQVWATYSPVKNHPTEAKAKAAQGNPTHSATTGELDTYKANCMLLRQVAEAQVADPEPCTFNGISVEAWPRVVLSPSFAVDAEQLQAKVKKGALKVGQGAVLVLEGAGIRVEGLEVAAGSALVVKACEGATVTLRGLVVSNKGWRWEALAEGEGSEEERMRGFKVVRHETVEYTFDKPGTYFLPPEDATPPASSPTPTSLEATPAAPEPTPSSPKATPASPKAAPASPKATPASPKAAPAPVAPEPTPAAPEPSTPQPTPAPAAPAAPPAAAGAQPGEEGTSNGATGGTKKKNKKKGGKK